MGVETAVPWPLEIKLRMSVFVTRPFFPVPGTPLMSMPSFLAKCLTAGVDNALERPMAPGAPLLPGGAVETLSRTSLLACTSGASLVAALGTSGSAAGVAAGVSAAAASSPSSSTLTITWPTGMISSSPKLISVMRPVAVEGILATSLSVKTSQRSWYCAEGPGYDEDDGA